MHGKWADNHYSDYDADVFVVTVLYTISWPQGIGGLNQSENTNSRVAVNLCVRYQLMAAHRLCTGNEILHCMPIAHVP